LQYVIGVAIQLCTEGFTLPRCHMRVTTVISVAGISDLPQFKELHRRRSKN
jgi:hypothetical protein